LIFYLGAMVYSLYLSFTEYEVVAPPVFKGLVNYAELLRDPLFWQALKNTAYYAFGSLLPRLIVAFIVALLLNQGIRGIGFYRMMFYVPSVTAGVAVAIIWLYIYDPNNGLMNYMLSLVGITGPGWLSSPYWSMPALIFMSVWQIGTPMIIFLAGLQSIPTHLHEAATIDGAGPVYRVFHITIPLMSPTIFFNTVMGFIYAFQVFTNVYILTKGGPVNSTLVYVLYIYRQGFQWLHMGYGSALAWVFFVLVFGLTLLQFRLSSWVYYEGKV
jgi:multiple sugar transport system permease protein